MKAILEFNLPEESTEHRQAIDGSSWECVLFQLDQHFRSIYKHGDDDAAAEFADKARDKIRELMDDYNVGWSS